MQLRRLIGIGLLVMAPLCAWQQAAPVSTMEQPDAQHTRDELTRLLEHYPSTLRNVLALDPALFNNTAFLAPYPALVNFLNVHPEVVRNPAFYVAGGENQPEPDHATQVLDIWKNALGALGAITAFGIALSFVVWLIRTMIDYRRWNRLTRVQTEVHTKILDRFAGHDDVLAYIQSPAGASFLQSSPIRLDAIARQVDAPMGRILWSIQGGLVLITGGTGLLFVSGRLAEDASQPLHAFGVLGIALGVGFVLSAATSFLISRRLGLITLPPVSERQ